MRFIRSLFAGLVVGGVVSCGDLTEPEPLPTLEIVEGFGQEALGNETLRDSLRVRLRRADGTPVPGATVVWTVSSGAISPVQTVTDGSGQAAASWSFYNPATRWWSALGTHLATATVVGGDSVMFTGHTRVGVVLRSVSITPDRVNVTSGDAPVNVTVRVTDDRTSLGVDYVSMQFYNIAKPSVGAIEHESWFAVLNRTSGTLADGVWEGTITVPQGSESGDRKLSLTLSWGCGPANRKSVFDEQLRSLGMPDQVTVMAEEASQPDVLPGLRPSEGSLRSSPAFTGPDGSLRLDCS